MGCPMGHPLLCPRTHRHESFFLCPRTHLPFPPARPPMPPWRVLGQAFQAHMRGPIYSAVSLCCCGSGNASLLQPPQADPQKVSTGVTYYAGSDAPPLSSYCEPPKRKARRTCVPPSAWAPALEPAPTVSIDYPAVASPSSGAWPQTSHPHAAVPATPHTTPHCRRTGPDWEPHGSKTGVKLLDDGFPKMMLHHLVIANAFPPLF